MPKNKAEGHEAGGKPVKEDLYRVLGVDRGASASELKRAYKLLALKHHPDKNTDNPESVHLFQCISHAYKVLSDPQQRRHYDKYGCTEDDDEYATSPDDLMAMFHEVFMDMMGGDMLDLFSGMSARELRSMPPLPFPKSFFPPGTFPPGVRFSSASGAGSKLNGIGGRRRNRGGRMAPPKRGPAGATGTGQGGQQAQEGEGKDAEDGIGEAGGVEGGGQGRGEAGMPRAGNVRFNGVPGGAGGRRQRGGDDGGGSSSDGWETASDDADEEGGGGKGTGQDGKQGQGREGAPDQAGYASAAAAAKQQGNGPGLRQEREEGQARVGKPPTAQPGLGIYASSTGQQQQQQQQQQQRQAASSSSAPAAAAAPTATAAAPAATAAPAPPALPAALLREWFDAAKGSSIEAMAALLARHPTIMQAAGTGIGHTALHWLAARGDPQALSWALTQRGADANVRNAHGSTPLHATASNGRGEAARVLLGVRGVDATVLDDEGRTAAQAAANHGHWHVAALIDSHLAQQQHSIHMERPRPPQMPRQRQQHGQHQEEQQAQQQGQQQGSSSKRRQAQQEGALPLPLYRPRPVGHR